FRGVLPRHSARARHEREGRPRAYRRRHGEAVFAGKREEISDDAGHISGRQDVVKSLLSILFAGLLLVGAAVFEGIDLKRQFSAFGEEVAALIQKAEEGEAGEEDGEAVYASWERRRDELHIWIPHNDISRIDDYLSESIRCLR